SLLDLPHTPEVPLRLLLCTRSAALQEQSRQPTKSRGNQNRVRRLAIQDFLRPPELFEGAALIAALIEQHSQVHEPPRDGQRARRRPLQDSQRAAAQPARRRQLAPVRRYQSAAPE